MKPVKPEIKPDAAKTVAPQLSATELEAVSAINASCRWPSGGLLLTGLFWLGMGVLLSAFAYLKLLMPDLLGDDLWMSYGRVKPASEHLLMYGFATPMALGAAYWMMARLGRKPVRHGVWAVAGAWLWNCGIVLGTGLLLAGDNTGFPWLQYPGNASLLLILGFSLIALSCWRIYFQSGGDNAYPSQSFLLGGLLWFTLAVATSCFLLIHQPVRGITQIIVAGWYGSCLFHLWLLPLGLAVVFYLIPQLNGRALYSAGTARFAFWVLALLGGGCGFANALPVPRWLPAVTAVCQAGMLLVVIAVIYNLLQTLKGDFAIAFRSLVQRLLCAGLIAWVILEVLSFGLVRLAWGQNLQFTWVFNLPQTGLLIGFAIPVFTGSSLSILPQLTGRQWQCARKLQVHFWGTVTGLVVILLGLVIAGIQQGAILNRADRPFNDTWMLMHIPLTFVVAGWVILAAAQFALLASVVEMFRGKGCLPEIQPPASVPNGIRGRTA